MGVVKSGDKSKKNAVAAKIKPINSTEATGSNFIMHSLYILLT